jgi:hypothetical protein
MKDEYNVYRIMDNNSDNNTYLLFLRETYLDENSW